MDTAKALDFAIRDFELQNKNNGYSSGYLIDGRKYWNYLSKDSWIVFKCKMSDVHRQQYVEGGGNELDERNSRWGMLPPKMASFGSSSRMIYNLSKETPGFVFEKQMPTHVGHDANLDGYLFNDKTAVFVEAKCREIYSSHTNLDISKEYECVYKYLKEKNPKFDFKPVKSKKQNHFKCTFQYNNDEIIHFDIKQLVCHFLGIAAALINDKNELKSNNIKFIYLIFNPKKKTNFDNSEISRYKDRLKKYYDKTVEEINKFGDMKWLFDSIMEFQLNVNKKLKSTNENMKLPNYSFSFELKDQEEYKNYLNEVSCQTPHHS